MEGSAGAPPPSGATLEQRLKECRHGSNKLNLSYLEGGLPADFVPLVLRANPHITELDLSSNQLRRLPDNLSELRELRVLRCKYNAIQALPPMLVALPKLSILELSGNQIERLDSAVLEQLPSLRDLDLSGNGLKTLDPSIASLPCLETLRLGNNALESLPAELGACPALARLDVSSNRLLALPPSLSQLQRIQRIDCKNNFLTRVPPALGHLALKEFDLRYNRLNKAQQQASEKGLARFLSWLKDEEEIERLAEIERNKPVGQQVGPCMVYRCRALTEDAVGSLGTDTEDQYAWVRTGHAICMDKAGKMVYMFGGTVLKDSGRKTADLFWLTTDRMEWRLQPTKGDKPCPRDGHCMVLDECRNRLVVFGGRKQNKRRLNDVHFLDLNSWTWFQPRTEGEVPSPRDQCSAVYHDNMLYIFGGRSSTARLNELHMLDLDSWCWLVPEGTGSAPSPRQAAALTVHEDKLWVHGGTANFVLNDAYSLDLESGEWSAVAMAGRIMPARHGHAIAHYNDELYLFGGMDALGAVVPSMYKLRQTGVSKYEWVETTFALPANKHRSFLFANGRLNVMQVGLVNLKLQVSVADLATGRAVLDTFQFVSLQNIKEKTVQPEDLVPKNAKLERIAHCMAEAAAAGSSKLPPSFTGATSKEKQAMQRILQFKEAWTQKQVHLRGTAPFDPPLVLRNEFGAEKIVCTTLRPMCLPHVELHELEGIAQFVSEYFAYEPLEQPSQPPTHLVSPWKLLDLQAGDCFDLANMECSLLLGAGYKACIAVGVVNKHVALNDQTGQQCPYLDALGISQQLAAPADVDAESGGGGPMEEGPAAGGSAAGGARLDRISECEEPTATKAEVEGTSRPATAAVPPPPSVEACSDAAPVQQDNGKEAGHASVAQPSGASRPVEGDASTGPAESSNAERAAEAAAGSQQGAAGVPGEALSPPPPPGPPRYLHAFVMVRPGAREVLQPLFIDPPTGLRYAPDELPCESIAFVWNQNNIWANLQCAGEQLLDPGTTDWSLSNPSAWEAVLASAPDLSDAHSVATEFSGASSFLRATQSNISMLDMHPPVSASSSRLNQAAAGTGGPAGALRSQRKSLSLQVATKSANSPRLASHNTTRELEAGGSLSYLAPSSEETQAHTSHSRAGRSIVTPPEASEMPLSWVPALSISRERLDVRCPKGLKRTMYRQCLREIFAKFGECSRWDGLVERYTLFQDAACTTVDCVVELFCRRKDRLQRRETYPAQRLIKDSFGPGATAALKESAIVKGERRELAFYHDARADGLVRRVEVSGISMQEFFLGRPDRLVSRKIKYGPPDLAFLGLVGGPARRGSLMMTPALKRDSVAPGEGGRKASTMAVPSTTFPFAKITERFSREENLPCDRDIAKLTFELEGEKTIAVTCHYGEEEEGLGRLTRAIRVYGDAGELLAKMGAVGGTSSPDWCAAEFRRLSAARKAAEAAGHAAEDESQEIVLARVRQEQNVQLITGHYDAPRNKVEGSDDEPEGPEEDAADYLAPYLPLITGTRDLTPHEGAAVFKACVQAMRDRATERALVLSAHRDAENAEIKRLEGKAAADLHKMSAVEQQRLQEQVVDAKFRLGVLEKRIADHSNVTGEKQAQLEAKLRADSRLLPAARAGLM